MAVAEFSTYAARRHHGGIDYTTVSWTDALGMRYSLGFEREGDSYVPRDVINKNPPELVPGKYVSRYDPGYFPTRKLSIGAAANRAVAEAAVAFANSTPDPFVAYVEHQEAAERRQREENDAAEALRLKDGFFKCMCDSFEAGEMTLAQNESILLAAQELSPEQWLKLGQALRK